MIGFDEFEEDDFDDIEMEDLDADLLAALDGDNQDEIDVGHQEPFDDIIDLASNAFSEIKKAVPSRTVVSPIIMEISHPPSHSSLASTSPPLNAGSDLEDDLTVSFKQRECLNHLLRSLSHKRESISVWPPSHSTSGHT
jgi:hypothetical protein